MKLNIKRIEEEMKNKGWDVGDLARTMKKHSSWVYACLNGKTGRTFAIADQFALALGLNSTDIVMDDEV